MYVYMYKRCWLLKVSLGGKAGRSRLMCLCVCVHECTFVQHIGVCTILFPQCSEHNTLI